MFELLCVFTSGGLVLWHKGEIFEPLNILISQVLLQERTALAQFTHGPYIYRWTLAPQLDIIFTAIYQQIFPMMFVDELLEGMKKAIVKAFEGRKSQNINELPFEEILEAVFLKWQAESKEVKRPAEEPLIYQAYGSTPGQLGSGQDKDENSPSGKGKKVSPSKNGNEKTKKSKKVQRVWDVDNKVTSRKIDTLDQSKDKNMAGVAKPEYMQGEEYESDESSEEEKQESGLLSRISNRMKNLTGNKELTQNDMDAVMRDFKEELVKKNVAEEIAQQLCSSVGKSLIGTRTASFTTVHTTVKTALKDSIQKLLTAKKTIDVLRDALASKNRKKPYVITFCGVNGVGKSTSLAKVGYYLKTKGNFSILMAACDTFRSGAIEQLRTHANTLEVPIFDQGYGKDPGNVARQAINFAEQRGIDVVLVDTAGRMQHNETLMQGLANLVSVNNPDLVLFVGEALVGNDGVDQLVTFNRALVDRTTNGRGVDGVLLTKFDTVDDKVGAALSMVYATGKPIVFVGTGERYMNLRRLNVRTVVSALLS